jgi:hypothetical protein
MQIGSGDELHACWHMRRAPLGPIDAMQASIASGYVPGLICIIFRV